MSLRGRVDRSRWLLLPFLAHGAWALWRGALRVFPAAPPCWLLDVIVGAAYGLVIAGAARALQGSWARPAGPSTVWARDASP